MATTVKITETYDLKTSINKMGIIGIHTPSKDLIKKLYPGLLKNHRFIRIQKCDVTGVCASVLPADPMQVGVESGDVAPEDMFNPILYKPVSNESFETIQNRMYALSNTHSLQVDADAVDNPFDVYYSLLSESTRWKKAMPQNGFSLRGLYPICYQMINTYGNQASYIGEPTSFFDSTNDKAVALTEKDLDLASGNALDAITFRGKSVKMPKFPIHYEPEAIDTLTPSFKFDIPKTYVAMFIIPPARLHEFYYRMRVSWTITFSGVCSTLLYGTKATYQNVASQVYDKNFSYSTAKTTPLDNETDLVDTNTVEISKIMES